MKIVASGEGFRWIEIKRALEAKYGKIPNNTLSNFIEKDNELYKITDPILKIGISKYL